MVEKGLGGAGESSEEGRLDKTEKLLREKKREGGSERNGEKEGGSYENQTLDL